MLFFFFSFISCPILLSETSSNVPAITFILDSPLQISPAMFFLAKEGQSYMEYNADGEVMVK